MFEPSLFLWQWPSTKDQLQVDPALLDLVEVREVLIQPFSSVSQPVQSWIQSEKTCCPPVVHNLQGTLCEYWHIIKGEVATGGYHLHEHHAGIAHRKRRGNTEQLPPCMYIHMVLNLTHTFFHLSHKLVHPSCIMYVAPSPNDLH